MSHAYLTTTRHAWSVVSLKFKGDPFLAVPSSPRSIDKMADSERE